MVPAGRRARSTPSSSRPGSSTFPASRSSSPRPRRTRGLLWSAIYDDNPVIFEHRTLYGIKEELPDEIEPIPIGKARVHREGEDVTVVATGRLVHEALAAAEDAEKEGVSVEVVDPRTSSRSTSRRSSTR